MNCETIEVDIYRIFILLMLKFTLVFILIFRSSSSIKKSHCLSPVPKIGLPFFASNLSLPICHSHASMYCGARHIRIYGIRDS